MCVIYNIYNIYNIYAYMYMRSLKFMRLKISLVLNKYFNVMIFCDILKNRHSKM